MVSRRWKMLEVGGSPGEVALATFDQSHAHLPQVRYVSNLQHLSAVSC